MRCIMMKILGFPGTKVYSDATLIVFDSYAFCKADFFLGWQIILVIAIVKTNSFFVCQSF